MSDDVNAELRLAGRLGASLELSEVRLGHLRFEMLASENISEAKPDLDLDITSAKTDDGYGYGVTLSVVALADPQEWGFTAEVVYFALYEGSKDVEYSEGEVNAFGRVTVLATVLPYLRELIQGLTQKAGLPPYMLPLFRVPLPLAEPSPTIASD